MMRSKKSTDTSPHWVNTPAPPYGRRTFCGDCAIGLIRFTLNALGDTFTESDIDTPEKAFKFLDDLDDKDGAVGPRPADLFFAPALGTQCEMCGLVYRKEGAVA